MKTLDFYFDYSCPWCYIGAYHLRAAEAKGVTVQYHGWKMPANANPPAKPDDYYDKARIRLKELRTEMGVTVSSPVQNETHLALIATKIAGDLGKSSEYVEAVFLAHWAEKKDISNASVLVTLAEQVGLPGNQFAKLLDEEAGQAAYQADLQYAADHNIDSIPSYIAGDKRLIVYHFDDVATVETLLQLVD